VIPLVPPTPFLIGVARSRVSLEYCECRIRLWKGVKFDLLLGGDGSFATKVSAKFPPVPPFQGFVDEVGPGYGRWVQTSDNEFKLTFYAVLLKDGAANGYQRVHSTMILSESSNEFTVHEGHVDFLDVNWKVVFSSTDEVTGKRLETSE
jgi:hypothetical protein